MKYCVGYIIGLTLFFPLRSGAQILTPTISIPRIPVNSTPAVTITTSPMVTVTPTATVDEAAMEKQMKDAQDEITDLNDQRDDVELEFRRVSRIYVEDLMRDKAAAAKKAGNKKKAAGILKEIADWDAMRQTEWNDDEVLLDKKAHLRQLQRDRLRRLSQMVVAKLKDEGLEKRVEEIEEGQRLLDQLQDLDNQEVVLEKQLLAVRSRYDYAGANEVRAKLKAIRSQYSDLMKQATENLKQIQYENPRDTEQQSL